MLEAAAILARLDAIMSELAEFRAAVAGAEADDEKGTSNCLYPWRRPGGRAHAPSRCPGAAPPRRHAFGRRQREHALQVCKNLWRDLVISKGDGRSFGNIMCVPIEHDVHGVAARFKVSAPRHDQRFCAPSAAYGANSSRARRRSASAGHRPAHALSLVRGSLPTRGNSHNPSPSFCSPLIGPLNLSSAASGTRFVPKPCAGR